MLLKNIFIKSKYYKYTLYLFIFAHLYMWDLSNIMHGANFPFQIFRYLILFVLLVNYFNLYNNIDKNLYIFIFIFLFQTVINYYFFENQVSIKEIGSFIFFIFIYLIVKIEHINILKSFKILFPFVTLALFISLFVVILTKDYQIIAQACNFFTFESSSYSSNYLNTYLFDSFLFHENSHFAMMFTCIFFFYIYEKKDFKNLFLLVLILILFIFYTSLTLVVSILVGGILSILINTILYKNIKIFLYSLIIITLTTVLLINNKNCTGRFDYLGTKLKQDLEINQMVKQKKFGKISEKEISIKNEKNYDATLITRNLSSQVYNIAILNTIRTITDRPFGWGFNAYYKTFNAYIDENMEKYFQVETKIQVKDKIHELKTLNISDARSTLLKILCEFGMFSLIFIFYGYRFLLNKNVSFQIKIFVSSLLLTQLISGAGYFNGGFSIFLFLMIILGEYKTTLKY